MGKILLAVEGIEPKAEVITYALELSKELGAALDILEVLPLDSKSQGHGHTPTPDKGEVGNPAVLPHTSPLLSTARLTPLNTLKRKLKIVQTFLEDSMCAASFAEAGENKIAKQIVDQALQNLAPYLAKQRAKIHQPHIYLKQGKLAEEIINFVCKQKKIIFTIFNPQKKETKVIKILQQGLPVPLVLVRTKRS